MARLLKELRAGFGDPVERRQATRYYVDVSWWLMVLLLKSDQPQLALRAADDLRAGAAEVEARDQALRGAAPPAVRQRESTISRQLEAGVDPDTSDRLRHELRSIQRSYRAAAADQDPGADTERLTLGEILEARGEALLAFSCHEMGIAMFVVSDSHIHTRWLLPTEGATDLVAELYQRVREFTWSIMQAGGDGGDREQPIRHGHWLWSVLIGPYMEVIGDRDLVIVADGPLHGMPWAALLTSLPWHEDELDEAFCKRWHTRRAHGAGPGTDVHAQTLIDEGSAVPVWDDEWGGLPYLVRDRRVRISMSIAAVREASSRRDTELGAMVGLADPAAGPTDEVEDLVVALRAGELQPLPGATAEPRDIVSAISRQAPQVSTATLVGPDATRQALVDLIARHQPHWLHIAAHGQVDVARPLRSRVFLAPEEGVRNDLTVQWLYTNPLRVPLVVLSCCETALGLTGAQEAVVGLPRAFLAGGAHYVIATLWRVPDDPRLIQRFYASLLTGFGPEVALADAQRSLIDESAHPVYWAGHQSYS